MDQKQQSICCLRALLDSSCGEGTDIARQDETCPSSINSLGGGLKVFPVSENNAVYLGDRCAHSKCEHFCNDRGGESVECTCRPGYDLGPDGQSCVGESNQHSLLNKTFWPLYDLRLVHCCAFKAHFTKGWSWSNWCSE
ncbi:hypothetical protein COOONC_18866 [Cooperia oncophora]